MKRRHFLQLVGSTLTTVGLSQLEIVQKSDRYRRVLAQTTGRKLALLVGINAYSHGDELHGCVTDVQLQQKLLMHHFGFQAEDIQILTDAQATRQAILTAFEQHLIQQAKPGDVVVFHFSGHGSQVLDPDRIAPDGLNSTFVPIDNFLSLKARQAGGTVPDIMGRTLFLLMSAVNTENVTVVLDCCYAGGGKRGNITVRALDGGTQLQPSPEELAYQQEWLKRLNLSETELKQRRQAGVAKGVVIASARRNQLATDARFSGFSAGAFTYTMTQYLWQQTRNEALLNALANIARNTMEVSYTGQVPEYEAKGGTNKAQQPIYLLNRPTPAAEAVITEVEGDRVKLWLGGMNIQGIKACDRGALFALIDAQGKEQGFVQLEPNSRQGLIVRGKLQKIQSGVLQVGTLLQERVRGVPTDLTLTIGIDPSLGSDRAKAIQVLNTINRLKAIPVQQEEVQYLLGRITAENRQFQTQANEDLPPIGSIGLFTPALEIVPSSFGIPNESVEAAVNRLNAKFKSLLAVHIVKTILNPGSSKLNVTASMNPAGTNEILASTFTARGSRSVSANSHRSRRLALGTPLEFNVTNQESRDLYVSILVIDPEGEMTVIFPNTWTSSENAALLKAGESLKIPQPGKDKFKLTVQKPLGTVEILVIASAASLEYALKALQTVASGSSRSSGPLSLNQEPIEVIEQLLVDVSRGTRGGVAVELDVAAVGVDMTQLAAMSITFESY